MGDFNITRIVPEEFLTVTNLWEASVRATHHFLKDDDILLFRDLILSKVLPGAKNLFAIRDINQSIAGFMGFSNDNLDMLFIDPAYFGAGLGKKLLDFARYEHGIRKLDVNEQNPAAIGFYQHMDFKIVSRSEKDGMGKPFPILHMEWNEERQ